MPKPQKKPPQLKDFLGKSYILSYSEKYEEFLLELGIRKSTRDYAVKSKPTVVLHQLNDDEYLLDTNYPEGRRVKVKFKIGEEIQRRKSETCPTTSVFFIIDNKLIEEQYLHDTKVLIEREFQKDYLSVRMEVNNMQCHRLYLLKSSDHSVGTETSRRFPLWDVQSEDEESSTELTLSTIKSDTNNEFCF